jgi:hypothetical protein
VALGARLLIGLICGAVQRPDARGYSASLSPLPQPRDRIVSLFHLFAPSSKIPGGIKYRGLSTTSGTNYRRWPRSWKITRLAMDTQNFLGFTRRILRRCYKYQPLDASKIEIVCYDCHPSRPERALSDRYTIKSRLLFYIYL